MDDLIKYVVEKALVIVPALWVVGAFLKRTPRFPDWLIPWALLVLGIILSMSLLGRTSEAFLQGILVAGAAVLGHQLLKQTTEREGGTSGE